MTNEQSLNKLYVGNFPFETDSTELIRLFSQFGEVIEAMVIPHHDSGKSKGFGFVTFNDPLAASKALSLNGTDFKGRSLVVSQAKAPTT